MSTSPCSAGERALFERGGWDDFFVHKGYEYEYVELTDEQLAEEEARLRRINVVNSLFGGLVACCCMAIILHTYIMQVRV